MERIGNREMKITRRLKAPVELVWNVCTDPGHIVKWWGPAGYTNTIHNMDFRKEGLWEMTMHDPDGTDYVTKSIFKEIVPYRKVVYEHFDPHFIATISLESMGEETLINWITIFDTEELRDLVIKEYKADIGQTQNMDRLEAYVSKIRPE